MKSKPKKQFKKLIKKANNTDKLTEYNKYILDCVEYDDNLSINYGIKYLQFLLDNEYKYDSIKRMQRLREYAFKIIEIHKKKTVINLEIELNRVITANDLVQISEELTSLFSSINEIKIHDIDQKVIDEYINQFSEQISNNMIISSNTISINNDKENIECTEINTSFSLMNGSNEDY